MKKCVKIVLHVPKLKGFLQNTVQEQARRLGLEGVAQVQPTSEVRIIAFGAKEAIDSFIDLVDKEAGKLGAAPVEVEPFIKDRDYRGIFRIIE